MYQTQIYITFLFPVSYEFFEIRRDVSILDVVFFFGLNSQVALENLRKSKHYGLIKLTLTSELGCT